MITNAAMARVPCRPSHASARTGRVKAAVNAAGIGVLLKKRRGNGETCREKWTRACRTAAALVSRLVQGSRRDDVPLSRKSTTRAFCGLHDRPWLLIDIARGGLQARQLLGCAHPCLLSLPWRALGGGGSARSAGVGCATGVSGADEQSPRPDRQDEATLRRSDRPAPSRE